MNPTYWYKIEDRPNNGADDCGFNVLVSRKHLETITREFPWKVLEERVMKITREEIYNREGAIKVNRRDGEPFLFGSISGTRGAALGLDFIPERSDQEVAFYSTHNCMNPLSRYLLERAFFSWAEIIDALAS